MYLEASILNTLPFSIYWIDPKKNILKGGNHFFINFLDKSLKDNFKEKPIEAIFKKEQMTIICHLLKQCLKKNKSLSLCGEFYKNVDNHLQFVQIHCCFLIKENLSIFVEIFVPEKELVQNLRTEKEKLEMYLNNLMNFIPASLYWKDKNGVILGGSRLHAKLAGYTDPKEVIGKTDNDFVWRKYASDIRENDRFVIHHNQVVNFEEKAILEDKKIHTFLTNKFPLKDKFGNSIGVLGVSIDITQLKEIQKALMEAKIMAEEANHAKTIFLANMSHDIRNPLTTIISLASFYEKNTLGESAINFGSIASLAKKLLELLNDILKSSETGQFDEKQLHKETFSLKQFLDNLQSYVLPMAQQSQLDFFLDVDQTLSDYFIICDRSKLYRILFNLLSNAVKFTKVGSVQLKVNKVADLMEKKAVTIQFEVCDTGPGIDQDKQPFIFDNLFRINKQSNVLGNGVGLYIVKKFVNLLGSHIQVKSELNKGSVFYFSLTFPFEKRTLNYRKMESLASLNKSPSIIEELKKDYPVIESKREAIEKNKKKYSRAKKRILLIEDDIIANKIAKLILIDAGFHVSTANNPIRGLQLAKKNSFDFIITDLNLPKMSGQEFIILYRYWERIQKKNSIPIFALTSLINTADSVVEKYGLEEFDAIWPKPISEKNIEELLSYTVVGQYNVIRPSVFYNNQESLGNKGKDTSALSLELEKIVGYPIFFLPLSLYTLGRDESLQKEILSIFHDNLEKNIIEIKEAYRDKNFNKIYQLVHNLKGSTGYVGAMRLDAMCKFFLNILVLYKNNLEKINKFYSYLEDVLLKTLQEL